MVDDAENFGGFVGKIKMVEKTGEDFAIINAGENWGIDIESVKSGKKRSDNFGVVGDIELLATDDVDVALVKFTEATLLGALATEIGTELGNLEGKCEVILVLDNITG